MFWTFLSSSESALSKFTWCACHSLERFHIKLWYKIVDFADKVSFLQMGNLSYFLFCLPLLVFLLSLPFYFNFVLVNLQLFNADMSFCLFALVSCIRFCFFFLFLLPLSNIDNCLTLHLSVCECRGFRGNWSFRNLRVNKYDDQLNECNRLTNFDLKNNPHKLTFNDALHECHFRMITPLSRYSQLIGDCYWLNLY